jgi:hypothetical protein
MKVTRKTRTRVQHRVMPRVKKRRITVPSFIKKASVGKERQLQLPLLPRSVERHLRLQPERRLSLLHQPQTRNELLRKGRDSQLKGRRRLLQRLQRRSIGMNALRRDAQIMLSEEECAEGMEQRSRSTDAALKDAQIKLRREEYARGMGLKNMPSYAHLMDART